MPKISDRLKQPPAEERKPPTKEEALELLKQRMTHKTNFDNSVIVLVGPWKNGKSVTALTISEQCPDSIPSPTLAELTDTWVFMVDPGGHDGFAELGLSAPYSDLSVPLETLREYEENFDNEIENVRPLVKAGLVKNVVFDSVSLYDDMICAYLENNYRGSEERYWGHLRQIHTDRFHKLRSLGCRLIVCVHPTENVIWGKEGSKAETQSKKKQLVTMLPGATDFKLGITGKAAGLYKGGGSLILPVLKETKKGGPGQPAEDSYWVHLGPAKGLEGGCRIGKGLDDKQPAHLRNLLKRIKDNQPKGVEA